ncbi:MAG: hypothetical protein PUB07_08040, partial [Clostridia bacterium]|nr:hypothetical protein [Clostridia bacterium]
MKKFFCIILAITLLMSTFVVLAADEKADFIQNGSFESTEADGTPSNWSLLGDPTHAAIDTKTVSDGKNAIQFKSSTENVTYTQRVDGINGGTEYTLTAYLYAKAIAGSGAQIKLEFYAGDTALSDVVKESYPNTNRKFEAKVIKFTAPTGATRANVLIRLLGGGEIYWDKLSLIGAGKPVADASGNAEFIQNGGFEQLAEDGSFASWSLLGDATHAMVETQNVHAEERAVHFKSATENVTYTQRVNGICGGSPYVLTAYLHAKSYVGSAQIKIEFYAGDTALSDVVKESYTDTNRKYEPKVIKFNAPTGATRANVLIRLLGGGDIYWDSLSLVGKLDENASTAAPSTPSAPPAADPAKPQESLETEELLVGYDNLVKNPGFEDVDQTDGYGPWYWNPYKSTTY